jgi:hypothetical protein
MGTIIGKNLVYPLELSQKFDFQPLTTKQNNKSHPTFSKNITYLVLLYLNLIYSKIIGIITSKQILGI